MASKRARIFNQSFISGSAADAWEILTDWHRLDRLRTESSSSSALATEKVELEGEEDQVPRTRVIHFVDKNIPAVRETLKYQDDEAMHYYYNIEGVGPAGIRNYLATTDVDQISDDLCQVTITARFDVPDAVDIVVAKNIFNAAHNSVLAGLEYALTRK